MKDAIKTKILSKRWKKICTSLSNLEFCCGYFENLLDFRNFVDKTLILHDGSDVREFKLFFHVDDKLISSDHLNAWITFAIQHNVEKLTLDAWYTLRIERFPSCFFTCSTLSFLSLKSLSNFKWPTSIKFQFLKCLDLQLVNFHDENVTSKLFSTSACPILEHLSIFYCKFNKIHSLSVSFLTLKYLQLRCEHSLTVNLSIPILPEFDYECPLPPNISCGTLSSMFNVSLNVYMPNSISGELEFRNSMRRILMGLHNVESLTLSKDIIEILTRDPDLLTYLPTSYCSLKHFFFIIMPTKSHVEVIACLLKTSPNLQTLGIRIEEENPTYSDIIHMQGYWQLNELSIAECLKHLRHVELIDFGGRETEMVIVRRLLESARVLKKIDISYPSEIEKDARMMISEKLSSFKRVSPHATIIFL
ncbi:hypothetical protein ACHQM5_021163 [Ranunculus cassubicifolius]